MKDARSRREAEKAAKDPDLIKVDTDTRFLRVFSAATKKTVSPPSVSRWKTPAGRVAATITRSNKSISLEFDAGVEPKFADFVASQLDELYNAFLSPGEPRD